MALPAVERHRAGQGADRPGGSTDCQIAPQLAVIIELLVTVHQREWAQAQHVGDRVGHAAGAAVVGSTAAPASLVLSRRLPCQSGRA